MDNKKTFCTVILAAGAGTRYGKEKQFEMLGDKEIWRWSYDTFKPLVDEIFVVGVDFPGGESRQESVDVGLSKCASKYIIIHDAVRPLIMPRQVEDMKTALTEGNLSVSFYFPSVDTIIMDDNKYLDRSRLKRLQVPQGFDCEMLRKAHKETKKHDTTDDCQLMQEVLGIDPHLILGGVNLHKLTYPGDLAILEQLMREHLTEGKYA